MSTTRVKHDRHDNQSKKEETGRMKDRVFVKKWFFSLFFLALGNRQSHSFHGPLCSCLFLFLCCDFISCWNWLKWIGLTSQRMLDCCTVFSLIADIVCSVGLVCLNKYLYKYAHFEFMMILSFCHFVFIAFSLHLMTFMKSAVYKEVPLLSVLPIALGLLCSFLAFSWFCFLLLCFFFSSGSLGSVAFMNLSLAFNSIALFQMTKMSCIPVLLMVQCQMFREKV